MSGIKIEVDASDVSKAKKELDSLTSSVEELESTSKNTGKTFVQAQKEIYALGSVSREVSKAVDDVSSSLRESANQLKTVNSAQQQANNIQNKATKARQQFTNSIEQQSQAENKAIQKTQEFSETTEQAADRIKKMVAASLENKKVAEDSAKANEQLAKSITTVNNQLDQSANAWQKSFTAQNAAMRTYHEAQQAAERQAAAEAAQAESAKKTTAENDKKKIALEKLLGAIDKTEKALSILDKQEIELTKHFREGRIDLESYNNALAKIQTKKNALTKIKNEAKGTTLEVNKLSKAVRSLSGIIATGFAGYGVVQFGKAIVQSTLEWDKAKTIMNNATGSASKAATELDFVRGVSQKLNIELLGAATSYSKLVAAAKDTPAIANELQHIFESINEAGATLRIAPNDMTNILTNFERMISTGKVQLTDLQQLANYIPGTFDKAAKALGTETKQLSEWVSKGLVPASEFLPRFADELHNAFGGSAQEAAQGLQGQLTALTNAWTDLKLEAGNAGFIDAITDSVKELRDVLQDPNIKNGLSLIASALGEIGKTAAKTIGGISQLADATRVVAEEAAKFVTGEVAADDAKGIEDKIANYEKQIASIETRLARLKSADYRPTAMEAIGAYITGVTDEDEIKDAEEHLKVFTKLLEDNLAKRKLYNEIAKDSAPKAEGFTDPLIKEYQEAKEKLAKAQQQITDQLKIGNKQADSALAEQVGIYQNNFDQINKQVQDKYDALLDSQAQSSEELAKLQKQYADATANLTEQQKAAILGQITQIKGFLAELDKTIATYKSLVAITTNPAFVPNKPENNNKGKTAAQRLAEQNENYVKGLEKQYATMNLGKVATLEYELSQRKLTGALLDRANAIKAVVEKEQELINTRKNDSMHIEILRLTGDNYTADLLEMENKLKDTIKELEKDGNEGGKVLAKKLFDVGKAKLQIDKIKAEIEKAFSNQGVQEQSIQAQVTAGLITQYEAQKRVAALHKQTAATVKQYLPELEKAAQIPGVLGEQSRQYLTDINSQLLTLQTTTSELENAFRNGMQDGIQSSIEGLRQGTMDLQDALLNIFESIGSNILNYAIQSLAENATGEITGAFSSLGSFFGFGMETPETDPQALAITTASQEGAMAMQLGIEQGAMMAAQTLSTVMSSMGATNGLTGLGGEAGLFGDVTKNATEAVSAISGVTAAKTAADATIMASAATSTATTQATTTAAAASAQAAWAPAAATAATASFGTAAMIGLAALMAVMTAVKAFKDGGHVQGPGTGKSDSIPAWLSNDEFVIQSDVVRQPGMLSFLNSLNRNGLAAIPRVKHATGGLAGIPAPNVQVPSYAGIEPVENVNNNSTSFNPNINVGVIQTDEQLAKFINSDRGKDSMLKVVKANPGEFKSVMDLG